MIIQIDLIQNAKSSKFTIRTFVCQLSMRPSLPVRLNKLNSMMDWMIECLIG